MAYGRSKIRDWYLANENGKVASLTTWCAVEENCSRPSSLAPVAKTPGESDVDPRGLAPASPDLWMAKRRMGGMSAEAVVVCWLSVPAEGTQWRR
jgi:hypothetical protein